MHLLFLVLMMKQREMLSDALHALRFYTGDVRNEDLSDPIYSDAKAYVTLNSLLFETDATEQARSSEGRYLNPAFLNELDKTLHIMKELLAIMKPAEKEQTVYRVERLADYECFRKEGKFTSFISCSDAGFLKDYEDKFDLVLMEVHIHKGVHCIRVEEVLNDYLKSEEKEVLISPYAKIELKENALKREYRTIHDGRNLPPAVSVVADVFPEITERIEAVYPSCQDIARSIHFYECLNQHISANEDDKEAYFRVKKYIRLCMYEFLNRQS